MKARRAPPHKPICAACSRYSPRSGESANLPQSTRATRSLRLEGERLSAGTDGTAGLGDSSLDDLLNDVLLLNTYWQAANTPDMAARGALVRREIPAWIRERAEELARLVGVPDEDLGVEGRDGTGLKTEVPWVRVHSMERSPSATVGWYIVYLFAASGERVYLSLNQGTTTWNGVDFVPRPLDELQARVTWARQALGEGLRPDLLTEMRLDSRRSALGAGYEAGNVYAFDYPLDAVPNEARLADDLTYMGSLLGSLYRVHSRAGYVPGDLPPEVFEVVSSAEKAAGAVGASKRGGKVFGLTKAQQGAVEAHAVRMAQQYLEDDGWSWRYVGDRQTWDAEAKKDDTTIYVEVKGTTSPGAQVILTDTQVREYTARYPRTMLVVVRNVRLDRQATPPIATGGDLACVHPWRISEADLEAISWKYSTGIQEAPMVQGPLMSDRSKPEGVT